MMFDQSKLDATVMNFKLQLAKLRRGLSDSQCDRLANEEQRLRRLARKYERSKPRRAHRYRHHAEAINRRLMRESNPRWKLKLYAKSLPAMIKGLEIVWQRVGAGIFRAASIVSSGFRDWRSAVSDASALPRSDRNETSHTPGSDSDAARSLQ